jgi:hypothetical protein
MARRIEYLLEEVRVLREVYTETTGRKRIPFTDEQRRRLAVKGKALTLPICRIMQPPGGWFLQDDAASRFAGSCSHPARGVT